MDEYRGQVNLMYTNVFELTNEQWKKYKEMQGVKGSDKMLHPGEFEYFNMPLIPDCTYDEFWSNFGMPLVNDWESSPSPPVKAFLHEENENLQDVIYSLVDPNRISNSDDDESLFMTGEYNVLNEHAYSSAINWNLSPFVDIWNSNDDKLRKLPPVNPNPRRRNARRNKKIGKISINTAARAALKRTQWTEPSHKRRKIENSVETTPSSSDYEDAKSRNRDAKCTAIRAINSFNSNTKAVKSEVQRTNHNRNEKKRREVMSNMMKKVRYLVPAEFYRERTEKARAKASKQKILVACEAYIHYLKETEVENAKILKREKKKVQIINRKLIKKWEHLKCQLNALTCRLNKF